MIIVSLIRNCEIKIMLEELSQYDYSFLNLKEWILFIFVKKNVREWPINTNI